jgi:hypothetical protein
LLNNALVLVASAIGSDARTSRARPSCAASCVIASCVRTAAGKCTLPIAIANSKRASGGSMIVRSLAIGKTRPLASNMRPSSGSCAWKSFAAACMSATYGHARVEIGIAFKWRRWPVCERPLPIAPITIAITTSIAMPPATSTSTTA